MGIALRLTALVGLFFVGLIAEQQPVRAETLVKVPGLALRATPIADVGGKVSFSLTAHSWPGPAKATIRYVSANHQFTGAMLWDIRCGCFKLAVPLSRSIHPLETAHATATVRFKSGTVRATTSFQIRGLLHSGKAFAPGGSPILRAWVADPTPRRSQSEQYCAWVHASDAFGMAGLRVRFVVRFSPKAQTISAGKTDVNGVACVQRSISAAVAGTPVNVDIYVGSLHTRVEFTPRD